MANEMTRRRMGSPEDRATTQFLKNRGKLRAAGVADAGMGTAPLFYSVPLRDACVTLA